MRPEQKKKRQIGSGVVLDTEDMLRWHIFVISFPKKKEKTKVGRGGKKGLTGTRGGRLNVP